MDEIASGLQPTLRTELLDHSGGSWPHFPVWEKPNWAAGQVWKEKMKPFATQCSPLLRGG